MPTKKLSRADKREIFTEFWNDYPNETIEDLAKRFGITARHIRRICKAGAMDQGGNGYALCVNCVKAEPVTEGGDLFCSSECEIAIKSKYTGKNGVFSQEEIDAIKPYGDNYSIKDDTESDE